MLSTLQVALNTAVKGDWQVLFSHTANILVGDPDTKQKQVNQTVSVKANCLKKMIYSATDWLVSR